MAPPLTSATAAPASPPPAPSVDDKNAAQKIQARLHAAMKPKAEPPKGGNVGSVVDGVGFAGAAVGSDAGVFAAFAPVGTLQIGGGYGGQGGSFSASVAGGAFVGFGAAAADTGFGVTLMPKLTLGYTSKDAAGKDNGVSKATVGAEALLWTPAVAYGLIPSLGAELGEHGGKFTTDFKAAVNIAFLAGFWPVAVTPEFLLSVENDKAIPGGQIALKTVF